MQYSHIEVSPRTAVIGADVEGVDLATIDDPTFAELKAALHEHLVLFFPEQSITPEEHVAFGRNFGHLAYSVENIYDVCQRLMDGGVTINRPPRDGHMAFVRSPDGISIELLQKGKGLEPAEPWASMPNVGEW